MHVCYEAIPDRMNIGNVFCERRSLPGTQQRTNKGFLNKYNGWVMLSNIILEGTKPPDVPDAACIPGDNMKVHFLIVLCGIYARREGVQCA